MIVIIHFFPLFPLSLLGVLSLWLMLQLTGKLKKTVNCKKILFFATFWGVDIPEAKAFFMDI